jgi:hypothetical protein
MFSLIRKILTRAQSLSAACDRLDHIEAKLERFEKLADENEALWQFLDEQKENDNIFVTCGDELQQEFSDVMLRNLKPYGDA